jgi:transcription initiation factor TFIIIB Brf1 subunit/transcription initiation factor TFIIB
MNESHLENSSKSRNRKEIEEDFIEEKCCENPEIREVNGEIVCVNCGTVHMRNIVGFKRRAFSPQEVKERRRTEPRWRRFGPRTTIPKVTKEDRMNAQQKTLFSRLAKIQKSLVSSIERNFWEARPKLKMLTSSLNIPSYIEATAWKIYVDVVKKQMTLGRTIKGFIAAALYASIRIHEYPITFDEVCETLVVSKHKVIRSLGLIINKILPEMGLKYHPITPKELVFKFANNLDASLASQKKAVQILERSFEKGLRTTGKDPRGFTAAALYLAMVNSPDQKTQSEIAKKAGITEVTLRNRLKDIKKFL